MQTDAAAVPARSAALVFTRLLALFYDLWPVLALWLLASTVFTVGYTYLGHHPERENIAPFSLLAWLLWGCCWLISGLYATASWRRGGQTLGMRPWRLRVRAANGGQASLGRLWLRFLVGHLSLLAGGLGFWWAWIDRDHLAWHDRLSGTRIERLPKP